ncbi:unnamed protein product [Prorocentrum cordatum]|uniref:Uncharacterized protein n=1 Tax=Prorocentrum cordatum TaxID=2364126 RepID=A0ABN9QNN6_9DINO|nr:unnamed protein product [Polarella glacialis]
MFENCDHVVALSILATEVPPAAWADCTSLEHLNIGNGVAYIGEYAFRNCSLLASVSLGDSVLTIRDGAFQDCSSLASVVLGSKLDYLGIDVFGGCHSVTAATVPSPLPRRIADIFDCSTLTSVTFHLPVTGIADQALKDCTSVAFVYMFDNVTSIGDDAFAQCSSLSTVTMSNRIQSIGARAFMGCSMITSLFLSDTVSSIGGSAFRRCTSLAHMELPPRIAEIAEFTFSGCSALENVTARRIDRRLSTGGPSHIQSIGEHAFEDCSQLKSWRIDVGDDLSFVGKHAFAGCSSLPSTPSLNRLTTLEEYVFADCTALLHVFIPEGVVAIGHSSFYKCESLQSVEWGVEFGLVSNHTITIGKSAFGYCSSLRNLTIPASVTLIEEDAFQHSGLHWATVNIFPRSGRVIDESAFPPSAGIVTGCDQGFELTIDGCACQPGKMFATSSECRQCGDHFDCPGGHLQRHVGVDTTVRVKEGYMTLSSDPFSVYPCVETLRCAGDRQVLHSMCTAGFDSVSPRCAVCLPDLYLSDGRCNPCKDVDATLVMAKWLASAAAQLAFNTGLYIHVNRPKSATSGTVESLIDFIQILQTLSRLDIVAPTVLERFFDYLGPADTHHPRHIRDSRFETRVFVWKFW